MKLYDNAASANCLKVRVALRQLGTSWETVPVDIFAGEARADAHLARNPDGRVQVLELDSGHHVAESAAILLYLAEGTPLLPADPLARATVHQWLFFEQNRVEASIAVARYLALTGRAQQTPEFFAGLVARGRGALKSLDRGLADGRPFVAGNAYTVADIALYAYVHCGADAGVEPHRRPAVDAWLRRVEATDGFVNDLAPMPAHAMV